MRSLVATALLLLLCQGTPVLAQDKHGDAQLTMELRALTAAIDDLTAQLGKTSGTTPQDTNLRKLDIAISYLNFRSRRIEMFERELQTMRTNRNRLEDVLTQFRQEEENISQAFGSGQQEAAHRAREELTFRRKVIRDRIERADSEIVVLENKIYEMQSQIDSVESFVQQNLEF